jgi:uroporphyrin-III C-methyltransferase/precorrin-2 dehydrogenase/sirohydrochlorin ferrochelatase
MNYLPLFIDLRGRRVLVVGGGAVAARKIALLLEAGAAVVVVARDTGAEIDAWIAAGRVTRGAGAFDPAQLDDAWFVIAATDDRALNAVVAAAAEARRMPANIVDDLELSSAILPAIIDRAPVQVAVSTGGASPVFARHLRERLEALLDESTGALAAFLERWRRRLREQGVAPRERRGLQSWMLTGPVAALVRAGRIDEADALAARAASDAAIAPPGGRVTLVGAGPGDPGLLTLNGLRALQEADVVLHDRLAAPQILALARREAELIDVGKLPGRHGTTQDQIHALLVEHARAGRHVVRLKGGDPFIFGRGGEELEVLRAAGIPYEVVPAVTAALGCAAYAGIPLTHRGHSQALTLVTAHSQDAAERVDWARLAAPGQTLAIYMGVGELERTTARLVACGLAASTPAALIENGTRTTQRVIAGQLGDLAPRARAAAIASPALLIVGEVAAYAKRLHWFGVTPDLQSRAED